MEIGNRWIREYSHMAHIGITFYITFVGPGSGHRKLVTDKTQFYFPDVICRVEVA